MKKFFPFLLVVFLSLGCSSPEVVTRHYTNGERKEMIVENGVSMQWNTDKSIRNKCEFKSGEPYTGTWITGWRRNLLHEECGYKDGRLHGDRIVYDWKGRPKWGRSYYMGKVVKKMTYRNGKLWQVEEHTGKVDRINRKVEKLARKIEAKERKRAEKEEKKREARERKEKEREKKRKEREEERKRKEKEREEAGVNKLEEKEKDSGEDLGEDVSSLEKRIEQQEVILNKLEQEEKEPEKEGEKK